MSKAILYVHGKGGNAREAKRFESLCPMFDIVGLDYQTNTPWDTKSEILTAYRALFENYDSIVLIANSIGAYFSMNALQGEKIEKALFISPIVDMETLIKDMMRWANISEDTLSERGEIETAFGETLSWNYLEYVRKNPINWTIPIEILYAGGDNLTSRETVDAFVKRHHAGLTVMENGEHWFHTEEQLAFLDEWIKEKLV